MAVTIHITNLEWSKAFYHPGETVQLTVHVSTQVEQPLPARLDAHVTSVEQMIGDLTQEVRLSGGEQIFTLNWNPPAISPQGYGVDIRLRTLSGAMLAADSTAFDVLDRWTQMPRYGFLTDFSPGRSDAVETMTGLNRYYINALQFYDWMYRHDQFLTDQDPYRDPLGRLLSRQTVDALISAAHTRGMAAMPYTAVYAASMDFYHQHPDWAIFGSDGKALFFGDNFLVYMDPRPDSPWTHYLLNQFDQILERTAFDGIHLDQYGDPKVGYDAQDNSYPLDTALAEFINATHEHVAALRLNGAVVFNAVTNWPIRTVAPSAEDIVYIEVWPPYIFYTDLAQLIRQGQTLGNGKAVVLAAYIDPSLEHNVRLMDAIIFASGGGHIELGEKNDMLADAYFPRYGEMSPALADVIQRDYDFAVRYQNAIGPETRDATQDYMNRIQVQGASTNASQGKNIVMPIVRTSGDYTAINLINLLGVPSAEWKAPLSSDPTPLTNTPIHILNVDRQVDRVWMASPDHQDASLQEIPFTLKDGRLTFDAPSLKYWDLILIKWESQ